MRVFHLVFVADRATPAPLTNCLALWREELEHDPDADFLLAGISDGFRITDAGSEFSPAVCKNYKSATVQYKDQVQAQILHELMMGNYMVVSSPPKIISALGAIPKPDPNAIRLIRDCSRPEGGCLNSYASVTHFKYETVDDATKLITPNSYLAKVDLRSAYRSVPLHPDCFNATGLQWSFTPDVTTYMVDTRLPFGASLSCAIFQRITNSVTRMMSKRGYTVISYLDDFLLVSPDKETCTHAYHTLLNLLHRLGFTINEDKIVPPTQELTFLGIVINSKDRTLALPERKLQELRESLYSWLDKRKVTKHELQKLIGKLNWAARVIRGGRTFLRRLIDLMGKLRSKHHRIRLNSEARADILWWYKCAQWFNGMAGFIDDVPMPSSAFTSDACLVGGAAHYGSDWFYTNWEIDYPEVANMHINELEMFTATWTKL